MTLKDAAMRGIRRLRLPHWADPADYLEIDITHEGGLGPLGHLYAPLQEHIGEPTPQHFLLFGPDYRDYGDWEEYTGPLLPKREAPSSSQTGATP